MPTYLDAYRNKKVLVTGGAGSIGSVVVKMLVGVGATVTVLSRDETIQNNLRITDYGRSVNFIIGDVRNKDIVNDATYGQNYVVHTAAMKHVRLCEENVYEAVSTNLVGAENVRQACVDNDVAGVVILSTDKAALPEGVMGMTKYIQERLFLSKFMRGVQVVVCRFGNVLGTRGSVVDIFKKQVSEGQPLTLTDPEMIRYVVTPSQSAEHLLWALISAPQKSIVIRQMPACTVLSLAKAIGGEDVQYTVTGVKSGEKQQEDILNPSDVDYLHFRNTEIGALGIINRAIRNPDGITTAAKFDLKREMLTPVQVRELLVKEGIL